MNPGTKKLISTANNFGNRSIQDQQGSTREIFDYIQVAPPSPVLPRTLEFFKNCNLREFPFTNINTNKLDIEESFLIERIWFSVMLISLGGGAGAIGSTIAVVPLGTGNDALGVATYSWYNDNTKVLKDKSLLSHFAQWNANSKNDNNNYKELETKISIQPLIPFQCNLKIPLIFNNIPPRDLAIHIGCHVEGRGSLFAPKHTY